MSDFEKHVLSAVENAIVNHLEKGSWIDWQNRERIRIDPAILRVAYDSVDMGRVLARVRDGIEVHIADKILASMATEIATDVKQIMGNKELREDLRSHLRSHMRQAVGGITH